MGALEDIFAQYGAEVPPQLTTEIEEAMDETPEELRLEGEWMLYSLKYPLSPRITKECTRCGNPFQTNYQSVACCSNRCVIEELREKFGLAWVPKGRRDKEKWEVQVPASSIPYKALRAMKKLVCQAEADLGKPIEIGVEIERFVLPTTAPFVPRKTVSPSTYMLPDLPEPEKASAQPPVESLPSHNQEVLVQEDSKPESPDSDPFAELFSL